MDVSLDELQSANASHCNSKLQDRNDDRVGRSYSAKRCIDGNFKTLNSTASERLVNGSLSIQDKKCFYQHCHECGVKRNLSDACKSEFEADSNLLVPVYVYVKGNSTRKQIEKVKTMMSPSKLLQHLETCMNVAFPRLWEMYWGSAMRRLLRATFTPDTTILAYDYSAVFEIRPQDQVNNYIPVRGDQLVIIASHSPREVVVPGEGGVEGGMMRVYENEVHHVVSKNGGIVQPNYFACDAIRNMLVYLYPSAHHIYESDGCKDQFKSRLAAHAHEMILSATPSLHSISANFAATGDFKGTHDGEGFNFKNALKKVEQKEVCRLPTVWDVHKAIPQIMGQPPHIADHLRSNANHVSKRHFWYIVDRREATAEQIERRWSPENLSGDVLIVDVDRDNWDCTSVKDISKKRQWIFKRDDSMDIVSNTSTSACQDTNSPSQPNTLLGNDPISLPFSTTPTTTDDMSQDALTRNENSVTMIEDGLCETSLPCKRFLQVYKNVSSTIRSDPCYCPRCRFFDYDDCLYSEHVGLLSPMNIRFKEPTRELRVSVDPNDWNPFEGDIQGESKVIVALRDADDGSKIKLALMTAKISKLTSNKTIKQNETQVTFVKNTKTCSVKVMSELAQTQVGSEHYLTYYIPTNTTSIVIDGSTIIQPECLFAEDHAFNRFNYLRQQESTTIVDRNSKKEKKTTFLVPPTSFNMLYEKISNDN